MGFEEELVQTTYTEMLLPIDGWTTYDDILNNNIA
jgi:hypothetical protein